MICRRKTPPFHPSIYQFNLIGSMPNPLTQKKTKVCMQQPQVQKEPLLQVHASSRRKEEKFKDRPNPGQSRSFARPPNLRHVFPCKIHFMICFKAFSLFVPCHPAQVAIAFVCPAFQISLTRSSTPNKNTNKQSKKTSTRVVKSSISSHTDHRGISSSFKVPIGSEESSYSPSEPSQSVIPVLATFRAS